MCVNFETGNRKTKNPMQAVASRSTCSWLAFRGPVLEEKTRLDPHESGLVLSDPCSNRNVE